MSKKIDRAIHGPGWVEVILGAVLSVILGVIIGAVLLILRPVVVAKETPKDIDRRVVYFIEGARGDSAKAKSALAKRKAFVEGQSISVTEDEINALTAPTPAPAAPAPTPKTGEKKADPKAKEADKAAAAAPASSGEVLAVGAPNFRIREGVLQIGAPVTVSVLGLDQRVIAQARGGLVKKGDIFVFDPTVLYLGSCPVQRLPFLAGYVREKFLAGQTIPEDIKTAWPKVANASLEGNALKLMMP